MQERIRDLFSQIRGTEDTPGIHPEGFDETCMQYGILEVPRPRANNNPDLGT